MGDLLTNLKWVGEHFGMAGLILVAWMWTSKQERDMIKDLQNKLFTLGDKSADVMAKVKVLLQERLPGRSKDDEEG